MLNLPSLQMFVAPELLFGIERDQRDMTRPAVYLFCKHREVAWTEEYFALAYYVPAECEIADQAAPFHLGYQARALLEANDVLSSKTRVVAMHSTGEGITMAILPDLEDNQSAQRRNLHGRFGFESGSLPWKEQFPSGVLADELATSSIGGS